MMTRIVFALLFVLSSCLPQQQQFVPREVASDISTPQDQEDIIEETTTDELAWFSQSELVNTLTVNFNNNQVGYLRGQAVNDFLKTADNYQQEYCLVIDFNQPVNQVANQLRVRVVPNNFIDYRSGIQSRFFRVNLQSNSGNSECNRSIKNIDASTNLEQIISPPFTLANGVSDVCPSCLDILNAKVVSLYQVRDTILEKVTSLNTGSLNFRIDYNGNSNQSINRCDNSQCKSLGFDCCRDGQCVNEAAVKEAGRASDLAGFTLAEQQKNNNPTWYLNYPQFYFSCLENPGDSQDPVLDPADPEGEAQDRLTKLIQDKACIDELAEKSESTPFHNDPINNSESYSQCKVLMSELSDEMYYQSVMLRMYANCGCSEQNFSQAVSKCPNYTYENVFDEQNKLTNIVCKTPPINNDEVPFQNLEIDLSSKSAPHRYFNSSGVELNTYKANTASIDETQEGTTFQYLDGERLFPDNGRFNMNSLLGQISMSFAGAASPRVIDIDFDRTYYIAVLSGNYTPCPSCGRDSWYSNFAAHPATEAGVGLSDIGFSTSRDSWGQNLSSGNYEDTKFGRACWLPPTMIPYSHQANSDLSTQRLNRLQTQAALYINGYQRDWYGFNKGAVIGSFDGVSWFAIGKGRIVTSTTNKLYLAINAPFADLALNTNHVISVSEYDFITTGARFDYDPRYDNSSPFQNEAGLCQKNHFCESDGDCITQLGWEYVCADVSGIQTKWPQFSPESSNEIADTALDVNLISSVLIQGKLPTNETKRCVYRGAGAPCRIDYQAIDQTNTRKRLACAPNFYCAALDANDFNHEVARFASSLEDIVDNKNHLYGMDANVLGRPKDYIKTTSGSTLPTQVQESLEASLELNDSGITGNAGICLPGKQTTIATDNSTNTKDHQHANKDNASRVDFISQVAGCDSSNFSSSRYYSCPMLDNDGNHLYTQSSFIDDSYPNSKLFSNDSLLTSTQSQVSNILARSQNHCGLDSLRGDDFTGLSTSDDYRELSPFKDIEARTLASSDIINAPTLAMDACLRKAGSICHTDLECGPNKLHAQKIDLFDLSYFGNEAEKKYWQENLICGQANPVPSISDPNADFNSYSLKNNRCCREIGKDLTMYTNGDGVSLNMTRAAGDLGAGYANRYSRYQVVPEFNAGSLPVPSVIGNNIFTAYQWKTMGKTGDKTCCGGGWIRKFADGSNDWTRNRLNFDVTNFQCLNYISPLPLTDNPANFGTTLAKISNDQRFFCEDNQLNSAGCMIKNFSSEEEIGEVIKPSLESTSSTVRLITKQEDYMDALWFEDEGQYLFHIPFSSDTNPATYLNWSLPPDGNNPNRDIRLFVSIYLPSWISYTSGNFDSGVTGGGVTVEMEDGPRCLPSSETPSNPRSDVFSNTACSANCCYNYNESTRILKVGYKDGSSLDPNDTTNYDGDDDRDIPVVITFSAAGSYHWENARDLANLNSASEPIDNKRAAIPGGQNYYLTRLDKLELLGIPQITVPPLYCSDNHQKLVPGIYKNMSNMSQFLGNAIAFNSSETLDKAYQNPYAQFSDNAVVTQDHIEIEPIFSSNEFMCCVKANSQTKDMSKCCSGYAIQEPDQDRGLLTCKIPEKVDLNVYFNRFVSGEAVIGDEDADFSEDDFDPYTGAPIQSTTVIQKVIAAGEKYCASGEIIRGGAFGAYVPEVKGSTNSTSRANYNIVDSPFDSAATNDRLAGYIPFNDGYRWNHHIYCSPERE